jgi:MoaA/NifB/PqqE/SkfB family radical SAM enzyme
MPERTENPTAATGAPVADRLRKVYVEPTNACNLNCRTCVRHAWNAPEGFMDWEVYEAVVEGLAAAADGGGDQAAGTIALMGLGEPLLHPRFLDMVRLAKERGLRAEVTTNALLLDKTLADGLLAAGLDQLVVSIDGASAETFGQVRSGASLEKVVSNVSLLHDRRSYSYGPSTRIGIEFVAMRSNVDELPGLNRLAAQLGASFVILSNVLAYTPELTAETLYDRSVTTYGGESTSVFPYWHLPKFDWDEHVGASLGRALKTAGGVSILDQSTAGANNHCPFVHADACAVAWHGGVSPCPPLLHIYTCYVQQREKLMTRWEVGRVPAEDLAAIWAKPDYVAFRDRVRRFDFPPCTDCACDLAEGNLEDCVGNPHPVCGDCLWARGIIRCA